MQSFNVLTLRRSGHFVFEHFVDDQACEHLRAATRISTLDKAGVVRGRTSVVDEYFRSTKVAKVPGRATSAVKEKILSIVPDLENHFMVKLAEHEPLQVLVYKNGDYFKTHQDQISWQTKKRLVTVVLFLNDQSGTASDDIYTGGTLSLYESVGNPPCGTCRIPVFGEQGLLIAFLSRTMHQVSPVTAGERYTIVTWFH